jgi:hypothetical protein
MWRFDIPSQRRGRRVGNGKGKKINVTELVGE